MSNLISNEEIKQFNENGAVFLKLHSSHRGSDITPYSALNLFILNKSPALSEAQV